MKRSTRALVVGATLLVSGSLLLARAGWVAAKGAVGEVLIRRALAATLDDGVARPPWRWADMHPVARLTVPRLGLAEPVLSNASGSAMAFGIGRVNDFVLAGHRDSWAGFFFELKLDDEVVVDTPGQSSVYRVTSTAVVRHDDPRVIRESGPDRLMLVTCWPQRGWLHSPWRYVVVCERAKAPTSSG